MILFIVFLLFTTIFAFQQLDGFKGFSSKLPESAGPDSIGELVETTWKNASINYEASTGLHKLAIGTTQNITTVADFQDNLDERLYNYYVQSVVPVEDVDDTILDKWVGVTDGSNDSTDNLWSDLDWHQDHGDFRYTCQRLMFCCQYYSYNVVGNSLYMNVTLGNVINTCFLKMLGAIKAWEYKATTYPWGGNWYQFSVSAPVDLVHAIYHLYTVGKLIRERLATYKQLYIDYVDKIYESPVRSLGWVRTGSNIMLQGEPFAVGHYWKGDLGDLTSGVAADDSDEAKEKAATFVSDWEQLMAACSIQMVEEGEGLRPDFGWIFHENVRAYGYFVATIDAAEVISLLGYDNNYGTTYTVTSAIMSHPNINANLPGLYNRDPRIRRAMDPGVYGVQQQYSDSIVNYKGHKFFMQFFGQRLGFATYEGDQYWNTNVPVWLSLREMWINDKKAGIRQYNADNIMYSPGWSFIDIENDHIWSWEKDGIANTHKFMPIAAASGILTLGAWDDNDPDDREWTYFSNIYVYKTGYVMNHDKEDDYYCEKTYLNGGGIIESQFICEEGRIAQYLYNPDSSDTTKLADVQHVAEVGILKQQIDDNTWEFADGRIVRLVHGTLASTKDVTYSVNYGSALGVQDEMYTWDQKQKGSNLKEETHTALIFKPEEIPASDLYNKTTGPKKLTYIVWFDGVDSIPTANINHKSRMQTTNAVYAGDLLSYQTFGDRYFVIVFNNTADYSHLLYVDRKTGKDSIYSGGYVDMTNNMKLFKTMRVQQVEWDLPSGWEFAPTTTKPMYFTNNKLTQLYYWVGDFTFQLDIIIKATDFTLSNIGKSNYDAKIQQYAGVPLAFFQKSDFSITEISGDYSDLKALWTTVKSDKTVKSDLGVDIAFTAEEYTELEKNNPWQDFKVDS